MLRMRLQRRGKKNFATYRVVVAERGAPIKGRFVADLGPYNPHTDEFGVDKEEANEWISKGVKPTATVHNLLVTHGMIKADKVTSWRPKKKEESNEEPPVSNESPVTSNEKNATEMSNEGDETVTEEAKEEPKEEVKEEKKEDKTEDSEEKS